MDGYVIGECKKLRNTAASFSMLEPIEDSRRPMKQHGEPSWVIRVKEQVF